MIPRDFAFTLNGRPGRAYAISTTHVCLALPIAGSTVAFALPLDEARRLSTQIDAAATDAEATLPTGFGESVAA